MRDTIPITKEDYIEIFSTLDKAVYLIDHCESREDPDNHAYSLAIVCAKHHLLEDLAQARYIMNKLLLSEEEDELTQIFEERDPEDFDVAVSPIPYEDTLEELREKLKPYLPEYLTRDEYKKKYGKD